MNFDTYTNCLRIQIYPDEKFLQKAYELRDYCVENDIGNVIVFMLAEAYFDGHSTKEEFKPWVEALKEAKRIFTETGVSFSLNPWMEMGHADRGRMLKEGQNFTVLKDWDGKESTLQACPYCEEWRKYFADVQAYYLGELTPDVIWIEDDFRLHNHAPLNYGGCYCDIHMKKFNEKLGTNYTREQLLEKIFEKGKPTKERKAWLDVNRDTICSVADFVGKNIAKVSPKTEVGLMSSSIISHTFEARDWKSVHDGLAQGKRVINRIHLPAYNAILPAYYYRAFNMTSMLVRRMLPDDAKIYPELENGDYNNYIKDSEFLRFQLESSIPLLLSGMTYNILDMVGNGSYDPAGYGKAIKGITPYLRTVTDLKIRYSSMEGIVIPYDTNASYKRIIRNRGWRSLYPYELDIAGFVSGLGINYKIVTDKHIRGEFVCLVDSAVDDFTDEELNDLFENNFVLVDAGAVEILLERGKGALIGAVGAERLFYNQGKMSYEEVGDWLEIDGHKNMRVACEGGMNASGDYLKVDYFQKSEELSSVYSNSGYIGKGLVFGEKFAVIPYYLQYATNEQYNETRRRIWFRIIKEKSARYILTQSSCIYPYLFKEETRSVIMLVNTMFKGFKQIVLEMKGVEFTSVEIVGKDGVIRPVNFEYTDGVLTVKEPLEHLSTATLILK